MEQKQAKWLKCLKWLRSKVKIGKTTKLAELVEVD